MANKALSLTGLRNRRLDLAPLAVEVVRYRRLVLNAQHGQRAPAKQGLATMATSEADRGRRTEAAS